MGAALKEALLCCLQGPFPVKKGTVLLRQGEVCGTLYFVAKGMARSFYKVNGKEVTSHFFPEDALALLYCSYWTQKPSQESLDVLENSLLFSISRSEFEDLYNSFPELHHLMRRQLEEALMQSEERTMMIRKLTAKERYEALLTKFPGIFLRASVDQIASFLGLSRETLSRLRSQEKCDLHHKRTEVKLEVDNYNKILINL